MNGVFILLDRPIVTQTKDSDQAKSRSGRFVEQKCIICSFIKLSTGKYWYEKKRSSGVRWERIESVRAGKQFCTILLKDGNSINFDKHVESLHALGKSIKRKRKELYQVGPKRKSAPVES